MAGTMMTSGEESTPTTFVSMESGLDGRNNPGRTTRPRRCPKGSQWSPA